MLLALDTSTRIMGVALHNGAQVLAESIWVGGNYHTVELAPEAAMMLRRAGETPEALTAIAVALGPGSYTGLRIGVAFAKGMALAHNLPLVGIPTLDILARSQPRRPEPMLVVIQAGRGRMAGVWYKWGRRGWKAQGEAESFSWVELLKRLDERTFICGEIDAEGRETLSKEPQIELAPPAQCVRRPGFLAELAWEEVRSGKLSDPAAVTPVYLES
jgi:tRNA threonylcarbamoyladenosine biosynthesis protein TsaB